MRSCMYCGKTLEKDEKCTCAQSVRAREAKNKTKSENNTNTWHNTDNVYTTGYTKKEKKKRFRGFEKFKRARKSANKVDARGLKSAVKRFLKDPVNGVLSPEYLSTAQLILLVLVEGIVLAGCGFFISQRLFGGMMSILSQGIAAPVIQRYNIVDFLLGSLFGGAAMAIGLFLVFGVFWCMDRFILKRRTSFMSFSQRLAYAAIPIAVLGILGILVGFFSIYALLIFSLVGLIMWFVLTYEALKCEWSFKDSSSVFYMMSLGMFIVLVIVLNLIWI